MAVKRDYYEVLGVPRDAGDADEDFEDGQDADWDR